MSVIAPKRHVTRALALAGTFAAVAALPAAAAADSTGPGGGGTILALPPSPLTPGLIVGFNPQPDPPGFQLIIRVIPPDPV
jgi:hypothetical protein